MAGSSAKKRRRPEERRLLLFCLPFLEPPKFLALARWAPYVWVIDLPRSEDIRRLDRTADRDSSLFWNIPEFLTGTLNVAQNIS